MTMLSAILPLPEDFDELGLAGFLRGRATEFVRGRSISLPAPFHSFCGREKRSNDGAAGRHPEDHPRQAEGRRAYPCGGS